MESPFLKTTSSRYLELLTHSLFSFGIPMSASTTFLHSVHFEYFLHHICQLISEIDFAKAYDCTRGVECQIGHCKSFTSSHQYDHKNFLSEYIGFGLIYTSRPKGRDIRTSWNNWRMLVFSSLTRFFFYYAASSSQHSCSWRRLDHQSSLASEDLWSKSKIPICTYICVFAFAFS